MKRFTEFRGTISRIDYDVERCTFDGVPELHPFLAGAPMDGDTDGGAGAANIAAQAGPADTADAGLRCSALSPFQADVTARSGTLFHQLRPGQLHRRDRC
ncbi:hypothetical protein [Mesorhizobium carmichaelinearum]|uniref:hypothetical protein n=1 Tax=Mesorhizobium carmichaelinearum TaxID=1208188 RepID=UPI000BA2C04B|nr:hypothetical protein [Mesorhizobium carmichaelinearum]